MTFKTDDRVYETSTTTGTGTYTLAGAVTGFQAFSVMSAGNLCPYFATDDTNWEVGIGTIGTGPSTLARTTILSSSNAGAAVNWGSGTRKIRCGLPAAMSMPRALSKSVAGSTDVTLTTDEQRRDLLVFTGALTGNISVIVDATVWDWPAVYNNTSGAYTLTVKVSGQTGVEVGQGARAALVCDGTDVRKIAPLSEAYIQVREEQASGGAAGTFTAGAWRTRTLNTESNDAGGFASVASNQVTLAAGTYRFRGRAPALYVDGHQCRLANITDSTYVYGSNAFTDAAGAGRITDSCVGGRFTISSSKVFELQHYAQTTKASDGFGAASSFGGGEVYTELEFWREMR